MFRISWENKEKRTYKLFPSVLLFVAPRMFIRWGSECSSPTMVGPTSCGTGTER